MQEHKINRTNKRPLAFRGELIVSASAKKRESLRWNSGLVFETDRGEFAVGIAHKTCFEREERDQYFAEIVRTRRDVITLFQQLAPDLTGAIAIQLAQWSDKEAA